MTNTHSEALPAGRRFTWRGVLALVIIFVGAPLAILAFLWRDRCHSSLAAEIPSPSGQYLLEQTITDCGPAMKVAVDLQLKLRDQKDRTTVLLLPAPGPLPARWKDERTLELTLPPQAQVVKRLPTWNDVTIEFAGGPIAPPKLALPSR